MFVGICTLNLGLYDIDSLSEKQRVIKRIIRRTQDRYKISMNETGMLQDLTCAEIGLAVVGSDQSYLNSLLDRIINHVEDLHIADVRHADFTIDAY